MRVFCNLCYAPVKEVEEAGMAWYSCTHCGYGQVIVCGNIITVITPGNKPNVLN